MSNLDVSKMSNDELKDVFETSFRNTVARELDISEFEVEVARNHDKGEIGFEVMIIGFAGSPSIDHFKELSGTISDSVKLSVPNSGEMILTLDPSKTTFLTAGDYSIYYTNS